MLTRFELDVLDALAREGDDAARTQALRRQVSQVVGVTRSFSGVGMFVYLELEPRAVPLDPPVNDAFGDLGATLPTLEYGAGFVLFIKDGLITMLEAYCYGEEWPEVIEEYSLHIA